MTPETHWHPTLNETPTPVAATSKQAWWECERGHKFLTKAKSTTTPPACRICSGQTIITGTNDLQTTHPHLATQWHPTKNGTLTPQQVAPTNVIKVWWLGECGHEWEMTVNARAIPRKDTTKTAGCPYCSGRFPIPGGTDLATTTPALAALWHPTRNGTLTPQNVSAGSSKKVWWLGSCGHEWVRKIYVQRTSKCPTCTGHQLAPGVNDLQTKYPTIASQWHPTRNLPLKPDQITSKNGKKVWWQCSLGHEWESKISNRTSLNAACPYCSGRLVLAGFNDLATVNPTLAAEWHPTRNGTITPAVVIAGSKTKYWWQCGKGHEWEALADNRYRLNAGCPTCAAHTYVSQGEKEIEAYLKTLGLAPVVTVRNIINGELDIYLPQQKIAIEYNGLYWHSEAAGRDKNYHRTKWEQCKQQGIQLIQIWEDDWKKKKPLVKQMLAHKLGAYVGEKTYARKTTVVELKQNIAEPFLIENHLQGCRIAKYYGLTPKGGDIEKPVAVIGVARKGATGLEIIRFATNQLVVGGFTKLLNHVMNQPEYTQVEKIYSYSHNDHSDGGVYEKNGFTLVHEGVPGYSYWRNGWTERQHRLKYAPNRVKTTPTLIYKEGASERELAELNKLTRIWDTGSSLWIKTLPKPITPN